MRPGRMPPAGMPRGRAFARRAARRVPSLPLQVNALQALCRQVFAFRLAMIALAVPFALHGTASTLSAALVGVAVLVTFMVSYVLLRDWERFGPVLLRHPTLLAADSLFGALLLVTASPSSTLAYVVICTPLLAGIVYGWFGAMLFAVLQSLLLAGAYTLDGGQRPDFTALFVPGLCLIAGALGSTLRRLVLGLGEASQALTEARARLAAADAVEEERARLAREMHDSVTKTLYGLAMAADGLARSADGDPADVRARAETVARAARRAATESRALLADLRREHEGPVPQDDTTDLAGELGVRTEEFGRRHGVAARFVPDAGVPLAVARTVAAPALSIVDEALENAARHARASRVEVALGGRDGRTLRVTVTDDGIGMPSGTALEELRRAGHFGLVGMVERAAAAGGRVRFADGEGGRGTQVRLDLPLVPGPAPLGLPACDVPAHDGGRTA